MGLLILRSDDVFLDVSDYLKDKYASDKRFDNVLFVLGYNVLDMESVRKKYHDRYIIIFQLEQIFIGSPWFNNAFLKKIKYADEIWDYDHLNIKLYKPLTNKHIQHMPFEYSKFFNRIPKKKNRDIDVLFYGCITPKRADMINKLNSLSDGYNIVAVFNVYGSKLNTYISRSKIILNIHAYENSNRQEQVRLFPLISSGCCIVSEKSEYNYFNDDVIECDNTNAIAEKISDLIKTGAWLDQEQKIKDKYAKN